VSAVPVAESQSEIEAELWASALRDAGLRAAVVEVGPGGAFGGAVPLPGWVFYRVLVNDSDVAAARNIIADLDGARALTPIREFDGDPLARRVVWLVGAGLVFMTLAGMGALLLRLAG
jgi:hypothetical protein